MAGGTIVNLLTVLTKHNSALYKVNLKRHPHKEIRKALSAATDAGFTIEQLSGHTWGRIHCVCGQRTNVYSTGRDAEQGAKYINRFVEKHRTHLEES